MMLSSPATRTKVMPVDSTRVLNQNQQTNLADFCPQPAILKIEGNSERLAIGEPFPFPEAPCQLIAQHFALCALDPRRSSQPGKCPCCRVRQHQKYGMKSTT